ncbi:hypothetical protein FRC16_009598 [Serendipita sp. 398]|nr:hypothetical protein FRC16_009598 [Serendipita sp. 398]
MTSHPNILPGIDDQPVSPLNSSNRVASPKTRTPIESKQSNMEKRVMEIHEMQLSDDVLDAQLATRLASTAVEQFLFFTNQLPFPVAKLSQLRASNDKNSRKRTEVRSLYSGYAQLTHFQFLSSLEHLLTDIEIAISTILGCDESNQLHRDLFHLVIAIGSVSMPKASMLYQVRIPQTRSTSCLLSDGSQSEVVTDKPQKWSHTPPPESDSDSDNDSLDEEPSVHLNSNSSSLVQASFTPFSDSEEEQSIPPRDPSLRQRVPLRQLDMSLGSTSPKLSDENSISNARNLKLHGNIVRDMVVGISNMDMFTNEMGIFLSFPVIQDIYTFVTELNKVCVYIQAPRGFEQDGWHPRPNTARTLDALIDYPEVESASLAKISKMKACAVKVHGSKKDLGRRPTDEEEFIWLEWDGKLHGVE